ncbi:MAG: PAS domain S-box protein [Chloroflexi bacterium]|nr:PAS domain S-box protein [Chloroflexota bacterium]
MADVKGLHEKAVRGLERQYRLVMNSSSDGVFIYLDDEHKACNEKLARLFGYSKEAWEKQSPFLDNFVAPESQDEVANGYWGHIKKARAPFNGEFVWVRKDGSRFQAHVTEFPVAYKGRLFAIGFVHESGGRAVRRAGKEK